MDPMRSCIICRKSKNKSELFRIVCNNEKKAVYDKKQIINSRGIYLCKNHKCLNKCRNLLQKNKFNTKLSIDDESMAEVLLELENELGE